MIKYNEAQSIRKTYEQIVKRLKEERIGYDNQLAAIERSLKGKEHDYVELLLLSHDATHAKELALSELRKYTHKKAAVRKLRDKYIEEKTKQLKMRDDMIAKQEKEQQQKMELNQLEKDDGRSADHQLHQNEKAMNEQQSIKEDKNNFEQAFKQLFEVTGTSHGKLKNPKKSIFQILLTFLVNEIITKFVTQDETVDSLTSLKKKYLDDIDRLSSEKDKLKKELDILKFEKADIQTRKQIDEVSQTTKKTSLIPHRSKKPRTISRSNARDSS